MASAGVEMIELSKSEVEEKIKLVDFWGTELEALLFLLSNLG